MKTVCCGIRDYDSTVIHAQNCKRLIKDGPENRVSHGLSNECFCEFKKRLDKEKYRDRELIKGLVDNGHLIRMFLRQREKLEFLKTLIDGYSK